MNVDVRPPRWRWLSRAIYAYFALWLSVWLDRVTLAALTGGLVVAGALLAATAPDLRSMRAAADTAGVPLASAPAPLPGVAPRAPTAATTLRVSDFTVREPAGGRLPLVVVDLDQTPLSRQLQRLLGASAALRLVDAGTEFGRGQDLLRQGQVLGLLLLPERLQETWLGASRPPPLAGGSTAEGANEIRIELYSGAGSLGRQRALLAAIEQVMHALPAARATTVTAGQPVAPGQLGVVRLDGLGSTGAALPGIGGGGSSHTVVTLRLAALQSPAGDAAPAAPASSAAGTRPGQGSTALLAPTWLPALLALPTPRPATALLIVQQTLLVVLAMMFANWTQERAWPVRRTWSSYLGVWTGVACLALAGCVCHLLPGHLSGWFDPVAGANWLAMLALLLMYCVCLATAAIWLAGLLRTREGGLAGLALLTLPLLTLAALPAPLPWAWPDSPGSLLPVATQALAWLLPATAAGHALGLLAEAGAGWADVAGDFAVLALLTLATLAGGLASWREPLNGDSH
ncbi:MAG: hypothetical protein RLZZ584_3454 [Pseudomonadota bacterium]